MIPARLSPMLFRRRTGVIALVESATPPFRSALRRVWGTGSELGQVTGAGSEAGRVWGTGSEQGQVV
jgi:hypothetical protein